MSATSTKTQLGLAWRPAGGGGRGSLTAIGPWGLHWRNSYSTWCAPLLGSAPVLAGGTFRQRRVAAATLWEGRHPQAASWALHTSGHAGGRGPMPTCQGRSHLAGRSCQPCNTAQLAMCRLVRQSTIKQCCNKACSVGGGGRWLGKQASRKQSKQVWSATLPILVVYRSAVRCP